MSPLTAAEIASLIAIVVPVTMNASPDKNSPEPRNVEKTRKKQGYLNTQSRWLASFIQKSSIKDYGFYAFSYIDGQQKFKTDPNLHIKIVKYFCFYISLYYAIAYVIKYFGS